jgi:hypothetical protein
VIEVPDQRGDLRRIEIRIATSESKTRVKLAIIADQDISISRVDERGDR